MTFVAAFLYALFGTVIVGIAAKIIMGLFRGSHPAGFGGFCVALGFAIARYSYSGPVNNHLLTAASAAIGAVFGLVGLWYWLIVKSDPVKAEGAD